MPERRRHKGTRGIAVRVMVFLLLGAAVNVAVAWGCAQGSLPWRESGSFGHGGTSWCFRWYEGLGADLVEVIEHCSGDGDEELPQHVQINHKDPDVCLDAYVFRSGWPMYAATTTGTFEHRWEDGGRPGLGDSNYIIRWRFGVALRQSQVQDALPSALPYLFIWPGFAINTLFYAVLLWLLFAFPFTLRRWRRIKRGLCAKCAYPVGASEVCTECGEAVKRGCSGLPSPAPPAGGASAT